MNYHIKTKNRRNLKATSAIIITTIFFLIIFIVYLSQTGIFFRIFGFTGKPVWDIKSGVQSFFGSIPERISTNQRLVEENLTLKENLSNLSTIALERDSLLSENRLLKELRIDDSNFELARVISGPTQSFYDILIIELRSDSKVEVGDFVWGEGNVALGTVIKKSGNLVHVELFSSVGKSIIARIDKDGTELSLVGRGGGNFFVAAPRALPVSVDDIVSLPLFSSNILARVRAVEEGRLDSFKSVYLTYPMNVFTLSWVRISYAKK